MPAYLRAAIAAATVAAAGGAAAYCIPWSSANGPLSDFRSPPALLPRATSGPRSISAGATNPNALASSSAAASTAAAAAAAAVAEKPALCTADELHYAPVPGTDWRLALWRYKPPREAPPRNHPLMLLSGVATNAIGFDLAPNASFARQMSMQGFDTWVVEVRGAGLSMRGSVMELSSNQSNEQKSSPDEAPTSQENDLLEAQRVSTISNLVTERFVKVIEEGQRAISAPLYDMQERFTSTIEDLRKQVELIITYDWDFDNYLEEDVPAAMDYIRHNSRTTDGKLLALGHSMGGILLYAMISKCGHEGYDHGLAAIVTLGSSVDYTTSNSSLKLLLPLADPAQLLNVPAIPLGLMLTASHPLTSRAPSILSYLIEQISAQDMMHPELFSKLVLNNFCTVPTKVLLQLTTAFHGGLRNRTGTFFYKDHLYKCDIPVLAIAGDRDLICPPEAVYETAKLIPRNLISYKVFGKPDGPHYAHYDIVAGRTAAGEIYPCIIEFLSTQDKHSP